MLLNLELVPKKAWFSNLRTSIRNSDWIKISNKVREDSNYTCSRCGYHNSNKGLTHLFDAHEVWLFDVHKCIQTLSRIECVCKTCHQVIHWGLSEIQQRDMNKLFNHALSVNKCSRRAMEYEINKAFHDWHELCDVNWLFDKDTANKVILDTTGLEVTWLG